MSQLLLAPLNMASPVLYNHQYAFLRGIKEGFYPMLPGRNVCQIIKEILIYAANPPPPTHLSKNKLRKKIPRGQ
jgi:hypothetical protein